jgi:hypothetical protein
MGETHHLIEKLSQRMNRSDLDVCGSKAARESPGSVIGSSTCLL